MSLAEWRAVRTFASVGTRELYDSLVGTVKESYLLQLSLALYTFGSRSPDEAPARQPIPGREPIHIGRADSIGAQSGRRIG